MLLPADAAAAKTSGAGMVFGMTGCAAETETGAVGSGADDTVGSGRSGACGASVGREGARSGSALAATGGCATTAAGKGSTAGVDSATAEDSLFGKGSSSAAGVSLLVLEAFAEALRGRGAVAGERRTTRRFGAASAGWESSTSSLIGKGAEKRHRGRVGVEKDRTLSPRSAKGK